MLTEWDKTCLLHLFVLLPGFVSIMITSSQLVSSSELQMLLTIIDSISSLKNLLCLGTSFLLLLLKLTLLPPPSCWLCKQTHLFLLIVPLMSSVLCCTFSFPGYLPAFVFKRGAKQNLVALSKLPPCLGDTTGSSAAEYGTVYNPEKCHPFFRAKAIASTTSKCFSKH